MHPIRPPDLDRPGPARRALGLTLLATVLLGCAGPAPTRPAASTPTPTQAEVTTETVAVRLRAILTKDAPGTLVRAPGWRDYRLDITNLADQPVKIRGVMLRDAAGRYFEAADDSAALSAPPDVATQVAGDVALRGVGIAAGEAIPYGGSIVGILSRAAGANAQQAQAERRQWFKLRNLGNLELAPGARFSGSAYLPDIPQPAALAIDLEPFDGKAQRIELPLPAAPTHGDSPPRALP